MASKSLKIGLIGVGKMGKNHLRVLSMLKSVDLKFIYDFDVETLNQLAKQYDVKASEDLEIDLQSVDAVVIVTPTFTHFDYIKLCSKYVKNIFVEKPLTDSLDTSLEIEKLVKEKELNIQIGFIERFNPAVMELKKLIGHSKNIINIDFIRTNKVSSRITDVDVITDLMIHDIDLALYLNGDYEKVFAYGMLENDLISFARATIVHKNGKFSNILASRITEKRIRQINVTADDMYIDCNLLRKEILVNKQSIDSTYENVNLISVEETINVPPQEALLSELITFVDFAREENLNTSHIPKIKAGVDSIKIASMIQKQILESK